MNRILVCLVLGVFLVGLGLGTAHEQDGKVRVLIEMKDDKIKNSFGINSASDFNIGINEENINKKTGKYISAYVGGDELEDLKRNDFIESVDVEEVFHTLLQDSVGVMNFSATWGLEENGLNLNGSDQTVCVIDTGVNYSHSDFGGCYGNNDPDSNCTVLGGWDFCGNDGNCSVEDDYPMDVHGHGTHVSGIIAGSGGINGTAPETKIVMMKAANATGDFSTVNIVAAIDWCVANASKFNISVISMSLGGGRYYDYCDDSIPSIASAIDDAVVQNISVVVAAGNDGWTDSISAPACVENAIPVGAVNKVDSLFYNRNSLVELLGVGFNVNSTCIDGEYCSKSGTSMATPMIAGAFAIINQYLNLVGQSMTPSEIEDVFYDTGKTVSESGNNYSRLNVYDALLSFNPRVTLVSPSNNYIAPTENQTFSCNVTDLQLVNATFKLWDSSGNLINTTTQNISGSENQTSFNMTNLSAGEYEWNCFTSDEQGNIDSASSNFTFIVKIATYLNSPVNNTHTNVNQTTFNCTAKTADTYTLTNITFNLYNSTNNLVNTSTQNISGTRNTTTFNYAFQTEDDYHWECISYNSNSDKGDGINYTITYDKTSPAILSLNANPARTSATITWTTNESSNSSLNASAGTWTNSSNYTTSHSITISGLSASTSYTYTVKSCDQSTNCNTSSGSFTTNAIRTSSGGSSGSSSTPSTQTIAISSEEFYKGKSQDLEKGDRITFSLTSGSHSLELEKVTEDSAQIIIRSDPINLTLKTGEETKLNLSSPYFYDLTLKLNSITSEKANIAIRRIFEEIKVETPGEDIVYHIMDGENVSEETTEDEEFETLLSGNVVLDFISEGKKGSLLIAAIVIIAATVFVLRLKKKKIKSKVSSKEE